MHPATLSPAFALVQLFQMNGRFLWLVIASFLAGAINAMAGGGSFLSFPAMLAVGVAPIQANATNTVALWPGQLTSAAAFREELWRNRRLLAPVAAASVLGGISGALVLLHTRQATFMKLVPWLLLTASLLFWFSGPLSNLLMHRSQQGGHRRDHVARVPLFFALIFVTFYIGYFGAGAGFLIMAALAIFGLDDIVEMNALKVVGAAMSNGVAVITFIIQGAVIWHYCLISMVVAAIGGYIGAHFARGLDARVMRLVVVCIGCGMAAYFFWKIYS
jgi:uncharacterized membrane protein YfcA